MKKWISLALVLALVLMLAACGTAAAPAQTVSPTAPETAEAEKVDEPEFEPMTLTFSMTEADGGVVAQGMDIMKEYVSQATGGAVTIDTYYASSLMAQDLEIESIMKGTLDMNACWFDWISPYMPKLEVLNVPYLFANWDHMNAYFSSDEATSLMDEVAETTGIRVFDSVYYKGVRCVNLNKDIKVTSRSDLEGMSIRMPSSEAWQNMGVALGANPVPLGASELYTALQTGAVDGQDNGFSTTISFSWYEVTKSVTVTGHMISAGVVTISEEVWQSLSPELQEILSEGVRQACEYISQTTIDQEASDVAFLEDNGISVYYLSDEELAAYRKEVSDYYFAQTGWVSGLDMELYNAIANLEY
ncbi:MAG: TRAP transporter substrate-binding protein DctP [Candidatus Limivicinus sp.]|nr:TRAP transporter substrate-binding protein DctP [Candidatus Limivicinus sp.]